MELAETLHFSDPPLTLALKVVTGDPLGGIGNRIVITVVDSATAIAPFGATNTKAN